MGDQVKIMVEALISPMHLSQETPIKTPNLLFEVGFQLNNTYLAKRDVVVWGTLEVEPECANTGNTDMISFVACHERPVERGNLWE